ncbi:GNAT family N-acetyltransferase, partial [Actinoalloteichus spitiensis]|uniref:GNAT family N-acetyltransferase n=1 Tax=Actinoalloteichus spitiensis TaxID=252394 RepID=UPI000376E2BC
ARPVACGGWRRVAEAEDGVGPGDAELKRMFVLPSARGRGLARSLLVYLEVAARDAGYRRMVLETGTEQPEAMALYRSEGYEPIPNFGTYREHPLSRCFAKSLLDDVAGLPVVG